MRHLLLSILWSVSVASGAIDPVAAMLRRHPELRLPTTADNPGCTTPAPSHFTIGLQARADFRGSGKHDVALLVVSKQPPKRYGVVVLELQRDSAAEYWVVNPSTRSVRGVGVYPGLGGTWLVVSQCAPDQVTPYQWTGRQFEDAPIY